MKAYKGFDKDLKCRGFQYESGKEYEEEKAKLCERGAHACENPLDTFRYYRPGESRYCEVELEDNGDRSGIDTKVCGKRIRIGAEIGVKGVIQAGVRFVFDKCESATENHASGDLGNAAASGWRGNAAASGRSGNAAASGESGNAAASGRSGNAAASGDSGNAAASGWRGNAAASGWRGNAAASGDLGNAAASGWSGNAAASGDLGNAAASGDLGNAAASGRSGNAAASGRSGNAAASGWRGNAAASGWRGNAAASGERGTAVATGEQGSSSANGEQCLAVAWGKDSRAKGKLGTWLVVTEYDSGMILNAKLVQVDGLTVKEETWYTLKNGEMVEA